VKGYRQVILGFLAALLSLAVILGSLSLSLTETGLKLALQNSPTRTRSTRSATMTLMMIPTTHSPGETANLSQFTPSIGFTPLFPSATLPPTPSNCPPPPGWQPIQIISGDSLDSLALIYDTTPAELVEGNCLPTEDLLPGTILYVPPITITPTASPVSCPHPQGWIIYTVQPGDNLYRIGVAFGVSWQELQIANCMGNSVIIHAGQKIYVPNKPTPQPTAAPTNPQTTVFYPTITPTQFPTLTPTIPAPLTSTPTSSNTPVSVTRTTPFPTNTNTAVVPSASPTDTSTSTSTQTETPTPSPTVTPTSTLTPTPTETVIPTVTPTDTATDTPVPSSPSVP
jgi:LysM repeat protein